MLHGQEKKKKDTYNSPFGEEVLPSPALEARMGMSPRLWPSLFLFPTNPSSPFLSLSLLPFRISEGEQVPFGALEIRRLFPGTSTAST